ncbi:MAG: hypothetical protein GX102_12445 [Porphyromonadaceae bacterium]|nr:hypothetical protein [Porphyromonadaceae bacterium]
MLNEIYESAQALDERGLLTSATNPDVAKVGECPCLLIEIDQKGVLTGIRVLAKDDTSKLWKHCKGNHNSFPAIRVQAPFLKKEESESFSSKLKKIAPKKLKNYDPSKGEKEPEKISSEVWKKLEPSEKRDFLQSVNYEENNLKSGVFKISEWSLNQLEIIQSNTPPELEALKRLIERFPKTGEDSNAFSLRLLSFIGSEVRKMNSQDELNFIAELLVGKYNPKRKEYEAKCMTYFDVAETEEVSCKVMDRKTEAALIQCLNKNAVDIDTSVSSEICPLTGKEEPSIGEKYPSPKLPIIGLTYLYSRNQNVECLTRYRMKSCAAFPASKNAVNSINNALSFLTAPEREKKTWKPITNSNQDKPNLLIAYLEDHPQNEALLAEILNDASDAEENEEVFERLCAQVIGEIKNVLAKNPKSRINLVILETLDPGRKQITYTNSFTADQFRANLIKWKKSLKNHPLINIDTWDKKEKKFKKWHPISILPGQICRLLKMNYTQGGKTNSGASKKLQNNPQKTSALTMQEIYGFYMPQVEHEDSFLLLSALEKTLRKSKILLQVAGQERRLIDFSASKDFNMVISLISALLWKLNITKENYMIDIAFNIGQFLQLSDLLHKEYCVQVRNKGDKNKSLPGQLVGNQFLSIATENPNEGLSRLRERLKVYLAWANSSTGEKCKLAKWILARYKEICTKISGKEIPKSFNTAEQAQVLLGYLAAIPYEKKEEDNTKQGEKENE